jgi:hypothetical protein
MLQMIPRLDTQLARYPHKRYNSGMKKADVKAVLGRVLMWPAEAQEEAIGALRAIELDWLDDGYHAIPGERAAIDEEVEASV